MADRVGEQLGNYRLMRLLGRGGFAEVYLGEHIYLETTAAIKLLYARLASDDAEQFRREARTIARLVHPHIVRVLEFGVEHETPYLVVDYAPDGTLRKRYPRGSRLPLQTLVPYVNQLADALQYAHDHHVIHRDVKPENMLIGRRGEVLLSDFGIALVTQSTQLSTQGVQDIAGTIAYMAPEQIQSHAVPASDQYALAVVIYEWLSGSRPFQGSFPEVAVKHTLTPPPALRERVPELSPDVEQVVMKALAKDPTERFPSVLAFAHALEAAAQLASRSSPHVTDPLRLSGDLSTGREQETLAPALLSSELDVPVSDTSEATLISADDPALARDTLDIEQSERTIPFIEIEPKTASKDTAQSQGSISSEGRVTEPIALRHDLSRRALLVGITGAATVLGAGGLTWLIVNQQAEKKHAPGVQGYRPWGPLVYRGHSGIVWSAAWMPRGSSIASAGGDASVRIWDARTGADRYIYTGHSDTVYCVSWSPNGKRVASASYDQTVQVWDADTGYFPRTYSGHSSWVWAVAWSPDGRYIASAGGDKIVQVWTADTLSHVATYKGHTDYVYALQWSPDSKYLASAGADRTVQIWEASTGLSLYIDERYEEIIWNVAWSPDGSRLAVAGNGMGVQTWNALDGSNRMTYAGHSAFIYALAWSSDGSRIASAGDDYLVHIWKVENGQALNIFRGHTDAIRSLTWSPDNTRVASASFDRTVRVWQAEP